MAETDENLKSLVINNTSYLIPETVYDFTLCLSKEKDGLKEVLSEILSDATRDVKDRNKRLWPIRAENYRQATYLLREVGDD